MALVWYSVFIARASAVVDGRRTFPLSDDCMISMSYARNLARCDGLVWNAGERVEGITDVLWTLLMAIPHASQVTDRYTGLVVSLKRAACCVAAA